MPSMNQFAARVAPQMLPRPAARAAPEAAARQHVRIGHATCMLALLAITFPRWFQGLPCALLVAALVCALALQVAAVWRAVLAESVLAEMARAERLPASRAAAAAVDPGEEEGASLLLLAISLVLANVAVVVVCSS